MEKGEMNRECTRCQRPFTPEDLSQTESRNMEAERKSAALEGVRFVYYHCPCGMNDIFVDILPVQNERRADFEKRRTEMEEVVQQMHGKGVEAVVVPVLART